MAIPARVKAIYLPAARGALRELAATGRRPTRHEIAQGARLAREEAPPEGRAQSGPVATDDVRDFEHEALGRSADPVDEVGERIGEGGADLLRQVGVDLRRTGAPVPEDLLNDPQVHAGFQQMGRKRMAQRILTLLMNRPQPRFTIATIRSTANR